MRDIKCLMPLTNVIGHCKLIKEDVKMEIPKDNFTQKVETNSGTAIISIPENATVDDLLYVKEMLDVVIKIVL